MMYKKFGFIALGLLFVFTLDGKELHVVKQKTEVGTNIITQQTSGDSIPSIRKIKDIIIYKDTTFFSTFPSVIKKPDGELIVAFRRAPDRKIFGEKSTHHVDPNSYLVSVISKDNGETWTKNPKLIYAHPFGGSQDPCLLQLQDGTLLCSSYGWAFVRPDGIPNLKQPYFEAGGAIFLGGYLVRSMDGGESWQDVIYPPHIKPEINYNAYGIPIPAYNRGAMYEAKDGRILWIVASSELAKKNIEQITKSKEKNTPWETEKKTSNHLIVSKDKGLTWEYVSPVAVDDKISFNEASVIETPKGDIVGFLRTAKFEGQAVISRSTDGGKTFKWQSMGFKGHPLNALRLPDNRVLLTYGYRYAPFGIRARILNAECTDFATAPEFILRDDGGNGDIGYTWPVQLDNNRVLVVYYFNKENGTRYIAGTIIEINKK